MPAAITQNINYNYKTNVQTLTRYHDRWDATMNRNVRTTQKLTRAIGSKDRYALRSEKITYRNAKATNQLRSAHGGLGKGMKGLALRFVGYQMILSQVMMAQQKMVEWVKKSITEFRDFEKKMAEVSTIIGDLTTGAMPRLTAGVESLSVRFGKSATDMAKGLYDILSAAFDSEDAIRLLATATKASIAGLADVSTSVDIFTSVLNAYGMTVSQAAHISDIFFQTIRRGKLVFEDLASAIGYVTPIAAAAGVEFEEIAAILATVTRMGLHVDMASRGLALTIQNIVSPTKQAASAARQYNVDMSGLALRVKGLEGFMVELNKAVKEHGATILPEMIRNMRSLRVVMAITSDVGIAGMTKDLDLMAHSAGQTEMAMSKMTAVTQMQIDILAQSMQYLERRIGESWSGFDIWWKKTQLWWGSLVSGGDANKALADFDERVLGLKKSYLALLQTQTALTGKGTLMTEMLSDMLPPDMMLALDRMPDTMGNAIEKMFAMTKPMRYEKFVDNLIPWDQINQYMEIEGKKRTKSLKIADMLTEQLEMDVRLAELGGKTHLISYFGQSNEAYNLTKAWEALNDEIESGYKDLKNWETIQEGLQPAFDFLGAGLDDLSDSIGKHKTNIIELQAAMDELKMSVETTYTAMSGKAFTGRLEWQIETKESEVFFDRFAKFSKMAIKYGEEFSAIEWFDKDIWDMIGGIEDYDGSMQDIIDTLHKYGIATKELKELQDEAKDANDELAASIRKNNLEIMKIQLMGMMRRRGQTRSEQKAIKKIEIENAQFRISQLENTIEFEDKIQEEHIDELKSQYDTAKDILDEYTNRATFNLYLLKDIRDDDIRDLNELYKKKETLLKKYTQWKAEENIALVAEQEAYIKLLAEIAERPETDEMYKKLYGFYAAQESIAELERLRKFQQDTGALTAGGGGGGVLTPVTGTLETTPAISSAFARAYERLTAAGYGGRLPQYHGGIDYVPETAPAMLQRGERVIAAGENASGDMFNFYISVDAKVSSDYDVERIATVMGETIQTQLADRRGKSKYRMR